MTTTQARRSAEGDAVVAGDGVEAIELQARDANVNAADDDDDDAAAPAQTTSITPSPPPRAHLDRLALWSLALQHLSSTWGYRSAEFAFPLYFTAIFPNTLLPASLYGLFLLIASLLFSPAIGSAIDRYRPRRLRTVRALILAQKLTVGVSYAGFVLLQSLGVDGQGPASIPLRARWAAFAGLTAVGAAVTLSNTGITIAVERDWVTTIAAGKERDLTRLNTIIVRIDLVSKLLAPLFVSLLTSTTGSDRTSALILVAVNVVTLAFEWLWIGVVYGRFTQLRADEERARHQQARRVRAEEESRPCVMHQADGHAHAHAPESAPQQHVLQRWRSRLAARTRQVHADIREFTSLATFPTSIALALLYTNVLSFDSTFLTYLKQPHAAASSVGDTSSNGVMRVVPGPPTPSVYFTDAFISGMRGLCVLSGLLGTFAMPRLAQRIGLTRLGAWSLFEEFAALAPVVLALWVGVGTAWNTALLFGGMALSRAGLWSYDLCQRAMFQAEVHERFVGDEGSEGEGGGLPEPEPEPEPESASHPERDPIQAEILAQEESCALDAPRERTCTCPSPSSPRSPARTRASLHFGLLSSLVALFDLAHFLLTIAWSKPGDFARPASVSLALVLAAWVIYVAVYVKRVRGHVVHLEKVGWRRLGGGRKSG